MTAVPPSWPEPSTLVRVEWAEEERSARVLRIHDRVLVCADDGSRTAVPLVPTPATVRWANGSGLFSREGSVSAGDAEILVVGGDTQERVQRRRYYRAPITLDVDLIDGLSRTPGVTIDLSEGGARVRVQGPPPPTMATVTTQLDLADGPVLVASRVVRLDADAEGGEVGLVFTGVDTPTADVLRRRVLTAQLDARRNGQRI